MEQKLDRPFAARYRSRVDRRQYARVDATVFCRLLGQPLLERRRAQDISLGGMRFRGDDRPKPGDRLELELFLPDQTQMVCTVEVVWVEDLPEDAPARHEVGVKFAFISGEDMQRLLAVVEPEPG